MFGLLNGDRLPLASLMSRCDFLVGRGDGVLMVLTRFGTYGDCNPTAFRLVASFLLASMGAFFFKVLVLADCVFFRLMVKGSDVIGGVAGRLLQLLCPLSVCTLTLPWVYCLKSKHISLYHCACGLIQNCICSCMYLIVVDFLKQNFAKT